MEHGAPKIAVKSPDSRRDATAGLFWNCMVCKGWAVGLKLTTHHQSSNRSPPAPGTEISSVEKGQQSLALHQAETHRKRESPDFGARTARLLARPKP
jgi:hypothetical protein